jgi:hypothetical protein
MQARQWIGIVLAGFLALSFSPLLQAQEAEPAPGGVPPVGAPVVREGDFAVNLEQALGVGHSQNEVQAESALGGLGVSPRNGWIADYPVTPDIFGELQNATAAAADAGKLPMSRDEALARLDNVNAKMGLGIAPYTGGANQTAPSGESYPSPADMNDYYASEGPPIVTYYTPPPDYYYLYDWIPYPFFVGGVLFPGLFLPQRFLPARGSLRKTRNHIQPF